MKVTIKFSLKSNVTHLEADIEKMSRELAKAKLQELQPGARFIAAYETPMEAEAPKVIVDSAVTSTGVGGTEESAEQTGADQIVVAKKRAPAVSPKNS